MPVNATHPLYKKQLPKWDLVRSIIDNDAGHYILDVDPSDPARSLKYRNDAVLTNFTKLTLSGLVGLVFRKAPLIQLPESLSYLEENATGTEVSFERLLQQAMMEILKTGRCGLLAELPAYNPEETDAEKQSVIKLYASETIVNWRYKPLGNSKVLSLVVLKEMVDLVNESDIFTSEQKVQYRVLRLDENNLYVQELYREFENKKFERVESIQPLDYNGQPMVEIPFTFIGSETNDADCDPIPLYDLAVLNLSHYKDSADLQESSHVCGQPSLFLTMEVDDAEFKIANPGGIKFGSRAGHNIGPNSQPWLLQANPNQLVDVIMTHKEQMIVAIGGKLIESSTGRETAEGARIRYGAQNSSLEIVTHNIGVGAEEIAYFVSMYQMETPEKSLIKLNDKYYDDTANPQLIAQQMMLLDRGLIAKVDMRDSLRSVGVIDPTRSDEDIDKEAEIVDPLAGVKPPAGVKPTNGNDG